MILCKDTEFQYLFIGRKKIKMLHNLFSFYNWKLNYTFAKIFILNTIEEQSILDLFAQVYNADNYPPIAGKILGLFLVSNQKYFTFEELTKGINASKSAVSKALKFLMDSGEVNFVTLKENKRKRHFYLDTKGYFKRFQYISDAYYMQTQLLKETIKLRNNENMEMNEFINKLIILNNDVLDYFEKKIKRINQMKKLLTLVLLCCFAVGLAQKRTYNIGMLLDNRTTEVDPLIQQMQNQIKAVVGEDANIQFSENTILVNGYDLQKAEQNYQQLLQNSDIILAFGVVNSVVVNKQTSHQKPTILFGAVNNDFNTIDLNKKTSGIRNFTYLVESESYVEDLKRLKELTGFKKVGIIIEEAFVNILPLKKTFDTELKKLDADYKLIPFKNINDITSHLDDDIDAVYVAGGFFLTDDETKKLAQTFIDKKLPSFTINNIGDVKLGIMATNQGESNIDQFFRRVALNVEGYVNGTALADMPCINRL